eukprot:TRINITY_DN3000_c0_g6_i1.p1 TRINITY_DN3000_c0_g6~~TRINITY_DN3000_c0_g6_i1.p1  ORF type:complete len:178 (-),score=11.33 TRINITY_DN3000_c0_g6_i1:184-687(-)
MRATRRLFVGVWRTGLFRKTNSVSAQTCRIWGRRAFSGVVVNRLPNQNREHRSVSHGKFTRRSLAPIQTKPFQMIGIRGYSLPLERDEIQARLLKIVTKFLTERNKNVEAKVSDHFMTDYGLDSLEVVELLVWVEEEFSIIMPDSIADDLFTIEDAVAYIASVPEAN